MSQKVSVESLNPPDHSGWMTKRGGSVKTWKKRWFVLKGSQLFYFKSQKDTDLTGVVELTRESFVKREEKKKKYCFAVGTTKRTFFMYPDSPTEQQGWLECLAGVIDNLKNPGGGGGGNSAPAPQDPEPTPQSEPSPEPDAPAPAGGAGAGGDMNEGGGPQKTIDVEDVSEDANYPTQGGHVRARLDEAKASVNFLQEEDSKVLEFWQIWSESMPPQEDVVDGAIVFQVATAADMDKLTWRTSGPQNIFIQRMVDFFWNVGAPETEIDRLNDVGALINPIQIGSWIDMSGKGGMDGGWFFPVDVPLKFALEASDPGDPIDLVSQWAEQHGVTRCTSVGRDMGAAPPRQTEIRFFVPGATFEEQLEIALSAYEAFGFPPVPDDMISIIRSSPVAGLALSVITSSEGFVRLGLMCPSPDKGVVEQLCQVGGGYADEIFNFQNALDVVGPAYAEYQYLMKGFGYGVYKEGFDIVFHYEVGEEGPM